MKSTKTKTRKPKDTTDADVARCQRWIADIDRDLADPTNWETEEDTARRLARGRRSRRR